MIDLKEVIWLAGFLEGDGSFGVNKGFPLVQATQKEKEPLERLHKIFGGTLNSYKAKPSKYRLYSSNYWYWKCHDKNAAGLMMTIYCFMTDRRKEQIRKALVAWKSHKNKWKVANPIAKSIIRQLNLNKNCHSIKEFSLMYNIPTRTIYGWLSGKIRKDLSI